MLAGALIAAFGGTNNVIPSLQRLTAAARADTAGVGFAFAVVAGAFLISSLLLAFLQLSPEVQKSAGQNGKKRAAEEQDSGSIWTSIGEGFRFVRSDAAMFTLFLLIAAIELFVQGPVIVGIPVLANTQLPQGALAVGIISSAYAAGALLGAVLAGALPTPQKATGPFSRHDLCPQRHSDHAFWLPDGDLACRRLGCCNRRHGRIHQHHVYDLAAGANAQKVMGRVMSLLMIASIGLSPISNAVSGALIKLSLGWVFVGAGAMMALLSLAAGLRREIAEMKMA